MRWIAAVVVSSLLLGFMIGGTSADQDPGLPKVDDRVEYTVSTQTRVFDYTVTVGEASSCEDGFGRPFDCQDVLLEGEAVGKWRVALSLEHAEVVSVGSWWVGGPRVEHFARPSGLWVGHPWVLEDGGHEERQNGLRLLLVGFAAGLRAATGGEGAVDFAGFPGVLTTATELDETRVQMEAVSGETGFVYTSRYAEGERWPDRLELQEVGTDRAIAEATRTDFQPGTGPPVEFDAWKPLDFPDVRQGMERLPWKDVPPGGADLFLGLREAWRLASTTPDGLIHQIEYPDSYPVHATYAQSDRDDFLGVPFRWGTWVFEEAQPEAPVRMAAVTANAFQLAEEGRWFRFQEPPGEGPRDWMPPREELPPRLVPVDDGVTVGASAVPVDLDAFTLVWSVADRPELVGTPDAANYVVICGPVPNISFVWAAVSAVNGQLLYRFAIATSC